MLEIHLPREIYKTPQAMEIILLSFDQGGKGSKYERWWKGFVQVWFSLEIVSIEGAVRFFIRVPYFYKDLIESRIYSQFPEIEISEAPDYTEVPIPAEGHGVSLFGFELQLTKPDPIPIKTYVEYEMHKAFLDEKQRFDPMTPMIEFLGSQGPGDQVWIQILVKAHRGRYVDAEGKQGDWRDEAKAEIKKIMEGDKKATKEGEVPPALRLTKAQGDNIAIIERNAAKVGLDCGIRAVYVASPGKFKVNNLPGLAGMFNAFNSADLNGFKRVNSTGFDVPWEDVDRWLHIHRLGAVRRRFFDAYKRRSYFYPPYQRKPFVLSVEELATVFHFPSAIAETPTLRRLESKKSEPPHNLPI